MRRLERAQQRHLRERSRSEHPSVSSTDPDSPLAEEFVTVLLLEIHEDGEVLALNCGHPWPYRLRESAEPLAGGDPLPPLGPFPLPEGLSAHRCTHLLPGDTLVLHTDGAEDARNAEGAFFCLRTALTEAAAAGSPVSPAVVVRRVHGRCCGTRAGGSPTTSPCSSCARTAAGRRRPPGIRSRLAHARSPRTADPTAGRPSLRSPGPAPSALPWSVGQTSRTNGAGWPPHW